VVLEKSFVARGKPVPYDRLPKAIRGFSTLLKMLKNRMAFYNAGICPVGVETGNMRGFATFYSWGGRDRRC